MTSAEYNWCVDLYADRVYRFVLKNIKNSHDAQDIVQNSFEKLWKYRENIKFEKARSWLFSTAYNNMIDMIRKNNRMTYSDIPDKGENNTQLFPVKDELEKALENLNDIQRSVILLRDYEGYSYQEIGEITDLNESQVKVYIYRARKTLQKIIRKMEILIV